MGKKEQLTVLQAFWSLIWRSTLLLPLAFLFLVVVLAMCVAVVLLPVTAVYLLIQQEWFRAAAALAIWLALLFLGPWKMLHVDSKDILNERENI